MTEPNIKAHTERSLFQPWMFLLIMPLIGIIGMIAIVVSDGSGDNATTAAQNSALLDDSTPLPSTLPPRTQPPPPTSVFNNPVPDVVLEYLNGEEFQLTDFRGKMLVVNFWATWCPPCVDEMPALQSFYENYEADDLEMVLVTAPDSQQSESDIATFVEELGITLPIGISQNGQLNNLMGARAMPSTFFIDENGITRGMWMGEITEEDLYNEIALLTDE